MSFVPPPGWELSAELGAGGAFRVARLRDAHGRHAVARRPRAHQAAIDALARHDAVLAAMQGTQAVPRRLHAGHDDHGPFTIESEAPGLSLAALVTRSGALPAELARAVARASFRALAVLHSAADAGGDLGFVHADLGPDHLFVAPRPDRGVMFIDFGLATVRGVAPLGSDVRGTMPYVAPERARGEGEPAPPADVYALAACFLLALTGRAPGEAHPAALVALGERGLVVPRLPAGPLGTAMRAALAFDPAARPPAGEIAAILE